MICPKSAYSGIPILLLLVQFYTHIRDSVWFKFGGMEERNTVQYFAMLFFSMQLNFNSYLYFIGELNMMNTWSFD
jgi:hypothetical protein